MKVEAAIQPGVVWEQRLERLIYLLMAALFIAVAAAGFAPRSAAILTGQVPRPPLIVHVHAALMVAWLLLFLAQTGLVATGRRAGHQTLGVVSFVLAPAMLVTMIATVQTRYGPAVAAGFGELASNILLPQIKDFILFSLFYLWAVLARQHRPDTHKRMMLMATWVLMDTATGRMEWLPGNVLPGNSYALAPVYHLILFVPAVVSDLVAVGRLHRAYVIGLSLWLLFIVATVLLWNAPWWLRTAPALMGVNR